MKSDPPNECSFCGASETDGARLWNDGARARDSSASICLECAAAAATTLNERVTPRSSFSCDGLELEWYAIRGYLPVLGVAVHRVDADEGCWLPFPQDTPPTVELAREVATKLRDLLMSK